MNLEQTREGVLCFTPNRDILTQTENEKKTLLSNTFSYQQTLN